MQQKKKVQWQIWLAMALSVLIGAVGGFLLVGFAEHIGPDMNPLQRLWMYLALILLLYVGIFLQLVIHETGHLVFGLWSGYRFSSFRIGSFIWVKVKGKIVCKRLSLVGTGGQCLMAPPDMVDGKIPVVRYNLGGCLMNLGASLVCGVLYAFTGGQSLLSVFFLMMTVIGVVIALLNGIPLRLGTVDNDGYNALSLGKDPQAMEALWLQLKINEQTAQEVRLRDMPDEWFEMPDPDAMKNSMVAARGVFICNRFMDQHRFQQAEETMEKLLRSDAGMAGVHRNLLVCDRIYCELTGQNRPEVLRTYYTKEQRKFVQSMKNYPAVIRTEYAWALLAQRDEAQARKKQEQFKKISKTYPYPSDIQAEGELMELAAQRAKE